MNIDIKGLPEGVLVAKVGIAGLEEYVLTHDGKSPIITQGPQPGSMSQVIVVPAPGWTFQKYFDIRNYRQIFVPSKSVDLKTVTVTFRVTNSFEANQVREAAEMLKGVPGYVGTETVDEVKPEEKAG